MKKIVTKIYGDEITINSYGGVTISDAANMICTMLKEYIGIQDSKEDLIEMKSWLLGEIAKIDGKITEARRGE